MKRFVRCLMSVVLAVGLMPLPAFADYRVEGTAGLATAGSDGLVGLQLNDGALVIENAYNISSRFGVLSSYIEGGDVAIEFEGSVAPRLMMYAAGSWNGIYIENSKASVAWNPDKTGGVARYSSDIVFSTWEQGKDGVPNGRDSLRILSVQADSKPVTVSRIVLTGADPLPDVSGGEYGDATVRRLYTRPVTLKTSPDSGQRLYRSTEIDLNNPVFEGADIAVRYTGSTPYLQFCYVAAGNNWTGFTSMEADRGARTACAGGEPGEKVTFFTHAEIDACWRENGGKGGADIEHVYVCVHPQSDKYPAGSEECHIVEVVALGGAERVRLSEAERNKVSGLSAQQITEAMQAGYNLGGHFESNYVPETPAKDGGWGSSDIASEAHWSRGVYITRDTIKNLKKEGFKAIRLPVTWFQHIYRADDPLAVDDASVKSTTLGVDPLNRYHVDRAFLERVHEVVDWCIAEDMFVIVNIHHEDWIDRPDLATAYTYTDLPAKFKAVWTQIANEFSGYDQRLVFEDMNEPHAWFYEEDGTKNWGFASEGSVTAVNRLNDDFVKLMRSFPVESGHQQRLLMIAHDTGNGETAHTGFVMPQDPYDMLAVSMHCYTPHEWTHYFAEGKHADEVGEANEYTDEYSRLVEAAWQRIRSRYTSQGYPVVLGEFGCYYLGEERQADRATWMAQFATHAKELGVPLFYWRMDRTKNDAQGNEYVEWSAFNEASQEVSPLSADMFRVWFTALNDESVRWGSLATYEEGEHVEISLGTSIADETDLPKTVISAQVVPVDEQNEKCRAFFNVAWNQIEGNEIAVKYAGDVPRLALLKEWSSASDWWGLAPDVVDEANHIAYFTDDSIETRWEEACPELDISDMNRVFVRTADSGSRTPEDARLTTTIQAISLLHKHSWGDWEDTGKRDNGEVVEKRTCKDGGAEHDGEQVRCPTPELTRTVHEWGVWKTIRASSCSEAGVQQRICSNHADAVQTRTIPAKGHWWDISEVLEPAGYHKEGKLRLVCANCGTTCEEALPELGHNWGDWHLAKEPTCTEAGVEKRICLADPTHIEYRESPELKALGHVDDGGREVRAATESAEGEVVHTCTRCATVLFRQSTPKLSASSEEKRHAVDDESIAVEQSWPTKDVDVKSGGTALVVDVSSSGTATLTSAKSAKGSVKVDTVTTADGRTLKVTAIAAGAFAGSKATKVTLGANVKKIGKGAFKGCKKLKSVVLGKSVKSIGKGAFKSCKKLKTITLRSSKLTRASFTNLLAGTKVRLVRLVDMSASVKKKAMAKYIQWLPKGVSIR